MKTVLLCSVITIFCLSILPVLISSRLPAFVIGFVVLALMAGIIGAICSIATKILKKENEE